jgi:adenylate cyclase
MVKRLRAITPVVISNADLWRIAEDREFFLKGLRLAAGELSMTTLDEGARGGASA